MKKKSSLAAIQKLHYRAHDLIKRKVNVLFEFTLDAEGEKERERGCKALKQSTSHNRQSFDFENVLKYECFSFSFPVHTHNKILLFFLAKKQLEQL
jgi:hypothetical protein